MRLKKMKRTFIDFDVGWTDFDSFDDHKIFGQFWNFSFSKIFSQKLLYLDRSLVLKVVEWLVTKKLV